MRMSEEESNEGDIPVKQKTHENTYTLQSRDTLPSTIGLGTAFDLSDRVFQCTLRSFEEAALQEHVL